MKSHSIKITAALIFTALFALAPVADAQGIFDSLANKAKQKAEQKKQEAQRRAEQKVEQTIDDAASEAESSVKSSNTTGNSGKPQNPTKNSGGAVGNKIWGFMATTVQVRDKWGKSFARVYISEITEVPNNLYKSKFNTDPTNFKPFISEYFKNTVIAAAKERGEEVSEPDDYSIAGMVVKFSVEDYVKKDFYTEGFRYHDKSFLDAPYQEQLDYAKNSKRQLYYFRWDPTGKNTQADLEKEKTRTGGELPN